MGARTPEGVNLVSIPGTERRPQNPGMAVSAGDFTVSATGNV